MKIYFKRVFIKASIEVCCDEMESALDNFIWWNDEEFPDIATIPTLKIGKVVAYHDDWHLEFKPIKFCPFCGEKIEVTIVK